MDKIILMVLLLTTPGILLPSWQQRPEHINIKVCHSEKTRLTCNYKNMSVRSYLELVSNISLKESKRGNFDVLLLLSIISNESGFNSNAIGLRGEKGLCQIMPNGVASKHIIINQGKIIEKREGGVKLLIPEWNIKLCTNNLIECRNHCGDDSVKIAGCHNTGSCPTKDTQYIKNFKNKYNLFKRFLKS
jgi:hypothetical protein